MNFNSTLIKAEEIIEGSWLENYAENFTTILNQIDNTAGKATYSIELGPKKPNPPTAGIIVTLIFYVINESTTYPPSSCELTLSPTEIFDRNIGLIPHTTENSTFIAYTPPPSAKFTWTPLGNILPRGQTITFNASESYLPLGIKSYIWDFGDGNTTTVRNSSITHVYQSTGTVTVILNITDEENFWAVANATLHILDEPQTPPTISVVNLQTGNGNFTFYTNITSVSSSFNVTIKLYNVADLQTYQIHLEYNSTILNCTRAWIPTWDTTWVFYGKATIAPQLIFGLGYIRIADSIERTYSTFSGTGILCIIEFRIIYAPAAGETFCSLNIDNANTFLLDSNWNEISSIKTNGNYIYVHQTVKVEAQPAPITQYIVGGTAAIVIIVVIGAYLMKIRKRK
jgi:PKD repeat protein